MASRSLSHAHPALANKVRILQEEFSRRFPQWRLIITSVSRTPAEQEALYLQGRVHVDLVNEARARTGMGPIGPHENVEVTWVKQSRHNRMPSEAVDLAVAFDLDGIDGPGKPVIDWNDEIRYRAMGVMAENLGLVWGGRWRTPDMAHVELPTQVGGERV